MVIKEDKVGDGGPVVDFAARLVAFFIVGVFLLTLARFVEGTIELRSAAKALQTLGREFAWEVLFRAAVYALLMAVFWPPIETLLGRLRKKRDSRSADPDR
ncbi:hypothetical protein ACVNPS_01080 [Candidatus Bipolaricaulota sp. J31]